MNIICPKCHSEFIILPESNEPLTWEELATMEGKPVWVEEEFGSGWSGKWKVIRDHYPWLEDDGKYPLRCTDGNILYKSDFGITWKAYRKERS